MDIAFTLFNRNRNLVFFVAKKINSKPSWDIIQECYIALWKASRYYNPNKGVFSTYACTVMFNAINNLLRKFRRQRKEILYLRVDNNDSWNPDIPLNIISDRQKQIILDYFFKGKTLTEIAREQSCSKQRIEQIKRKGLENLGNEILKSW